MPEENPRVQVDIYNLSYTVDKLGERTRVVEVRREYIDHCATRTPHLSRTLLFVEL